jgi:hypothetical protein
MIRINVAVHSANSCILLWVADWLAVINLGTTELIERLQIVKAIVYTFLRMTFL